MITLYWCPKTRAMRGLWMLEELGEPFEVAEIDIRDPKSRHDPAFRAASPMGKVPAIADGEVRMAESAAISLYLADRYPSAGLAPPPDHHDRGRYLYWMVFTPGVIEPAMAERFNRWAPNRGQHGWGDFETMIATLERGLEQGPWLLGDRFSAADVLVGSSTHFMRMFGILPDSQALNEYTDRCLERPAFQRAMEREQAAGD